MRITHRLSRAMTDGIQHGILASFWRGGTSNGLLISGKDLPVWRTLSDAQKQDLRHCEQILQPFFVAAMGSPDPYGRQLNGMGGGVSSLSKAIIVEEARSSAQLGMVDYYFIQIGIKDGKLDMAGNCGNMSSAVAPFALNAGIISNPVSCLADPGSNSCRTTMEMVIRNMNTNKQIKTAMNVIKANDSWRFNSQGDYVLDGVSGTASPVTLTFLDPAGSKTGKALPSGNKIDTLTIDGKELKASLTDISNPGVFVDGRDIGWDPDLHPDQLTADTALMGRLEAIRREGTRRMGLDPDVPSIPKIVLVYPPHNDQVDVRCQALSMQQAHKAVPVTLALNLGVTCKLEGTIPHQLARHRNPSTTVVGHPSGKLEVGAEVKDDKIIGAKLVRTARWLMNGFVNDEPSTPS